MKRLVACLAVLALAGCPAEGPGSSASTKPIQIKGSDTMVNLGQAWAEAFMKVHPDISVAVTGGGSGTGIAALANRTCDLAQCSRAIKAKESETIAKATGKKPVEIQVGIDALVVAINPKNPVDKLTFPQLAAIFTGKVDNWKDVGGPDKKIVVVSRDRSSGTHVYFLEHVLRGGNEKGPEEYASSALMAPSSQAIVDEVATNEAAIGYYGLGYLNPKNKAVAVARTEKDAFTLPSMDSAVKGEYPISRPLYMYSPGEAAGDVKTYVDFVLSDEGQKIVKKLDFVPLRPLSGS